MDAVVFLPRYGREMNQGKLTEELRSLMEGLAIKPARREAP
jgi:hypothetical protein